MLDGLRIRLRAIFRPGAMESELDQELGHHLEAQMEQYRQAGLTAEEARRRSRLDFGGVDLVKEECRDARGIRLVDELRQDLRYGLRAFWRNRLASAAAVGTLALGIGVNAAMFAVLDWVLLRPLPYPAPQELVSASRSGPSGALTPLTVTEYRRFGAAAAFRKSAALSPVIRVMEGPGLEPTHVTVVRVVGDLAGTLELRARPGRGFDLAEAESGAPVVMVSHQFWRARLAEDPRVIGRAVTIDGSPHTVIGVIPTDQAYPRAGDVWQPLPREAREDDDREHVMIARLGSGVTLERARAEIAALVPAARLESLQRKEVQDVRSTLLALMASTALILLMACANVAALLGARGLDRLSDLAIHGALGASRGRMVRRLLTESALLVFTGALLGLLLGHWTLQAVIGLAPAGLPRSEEIALDGRILLAGVSTSVLVAILVGAAPALRASRVDLRSAFRSSGAVHSAGRRRGRRMLVAAQTGMALVVTIGAGLLGRSLQQQLRIDHGFDPEGLLVMDLHLRGGDFATAQRLFRDLIEAAEQVPGVQAAAIGLSPPTVVRGFRTAVAIVGQPAEGPFVVRLRPVTTGYLETVGLPLSDGRLLTAADQRQAPSVALANRAFVRQLPGNPVVGARITSDLVDREMTIVGVVGDVTPGGEADQPALYVSTEQFPIVGGSLVVRTTGQEATALPLLRARLREAAPRLPVDRLESAGDLLSQGRALTRFNALLAGTFAALALLLAAIGVYGLAASEVTSRWRQLAIQSALGATVPRVLWTVLRPAAGAIGLGMMAGLCGALVTSRWLEALLYGIGPSDPVTLLSVSGLLAVVGGAAALAAAWPVLRHDPAAALREE